MTPRVLPTRPGSPDAGVLAEAATALRSGEVVGIPTDTVYGLAVDPRQPGASERIFALKARPRDVVLPVLVADEAQALELASGVGAGVRRLMAAWWPGPLTIVVPRRADLGIDLGGDATTVGLRCPAHAVPRALASAVGPLATTSANRHGRPPATTAAELAAGLVGVAVVIDAGECRGTPSSVVDCTSATPRLLRSGAIPWARILVTLAGGDDPPT